MNRKTAEQGSELPQAPQFGETEERKLASLFRLWREKSGLGAREERQLSFLLKALVKSRAAEALETDAFLRLVEPFAGEVEFSDDEKRSLLRRVKPLLKTRELTTDEKNELAGLFDRYRMRLSSKLRRSISAALEAQFEPDDVLNEAYIRAGTHWYARPEDPQKDYVWLYGIVHDQFCDMLRKANAAKRGGQIKEVRIPDNSAAEMAMEVWQSQTGPSTMAARKEFVSRVRGVLERHLGTSDVEIVLMRVFDRLEFPEIVAELVRRAEENDRAADYQRILAKLDSRTHGGDRAGEADDQDVNKRRADAIRQRFKRAIGNLTGALIAEFPELLDALHSLNSAMA